MRTLTARQDFDRLFAQGVSAQTALIKVVVAPSPTTGGRVAFVAPKRLGSAVFRNRCKRVLRACAAEAGLPRARWDVVVLAKPRVATASHEAVVTALTGALIQAHKRLARRANQKAAPHEKSLSHHG